MKKLILSALLSYCVTQLALAQWSNGNNIYNTNNGNVGIGTASPQFKLHVIGDISIDQPHALIFANGQAIRDNGGGGLTISSGYSISNYLGGTGPGIYTVIGGNVGFGTSNPTSLLHLASANNIDLKLFSSAAGGYSRLFFSAGTNGARWNVGQRDDEGGIFSIEGDSNGGGAWGNRLAVTLSGNVGIGTISPGDKLDISGVTRISNASKTNQYTQIYTAGAVSYFDGNTNSDVYNGVQHIFREGQNEKMRIDVSGNVGIGTTVPDQKLTVKGTVHATQVKVDLNVPGPDYVFKKNYNLPNLAVVKRYISKNRHLSDIPSSVQMQKDGIDLGEMNVKLLKKVEELTLYLLSEHENNRKLQTKVNALTKNVSTLLNRSKTILQ